MGDQLPVTSRSQLTARSDASSERSPDTYRKRAGIPSRFDYPHCPSDAWVVQAPVIPALYSYNPIRHTVDKFIVDRSTGRMVQYRTNRESPDLEPSAKDGIRVNRRKGVLEYADLTRPTAERWSNAYHKTLNKNPKAFCHTPSPLSQFVENAVRNQDNPFRTRR
jgi:hypothetical protein